MRRWVNDERTVRARREPVTRSVYSNSPRWTKYDTSSPFSLPHERVHNGLVPAHRPYIPSSYSPHTGFSPCATACIHTAKVLGMPTTFAGSRLVSLATNRPLPCMVTAITQRPAVCPHRFSPTTQNLPHGRLCRRHGTANFNSKKLTCFLRSLAGQRTASGTFMFAN